MHHNRSSRCRFAVDVTLGEKLSNNFSQVNSSVIQEPHERMVVITHQKTQHDGRACSDRWSYPDRPGWIWSGTDSSPSATSNMTILVKHHEWTTKVHRCVTSRGFLHIRCSSAPGASHSRSHGVSAARGQPGWTGRTPNNNNLPVLNSEQHRKTENQYNVISKYLKKKCLYCIPLVFIADIFCCLCYCDCPHMSYFVLSCLILSRFVSFCLILSCLALSCPLTC